jgi:hypothetical protein
MAIGRMSLYSVEGSRTEVKLIGKVQARSQYLKSEKMYKGPHDTGKLSP